MRSRSTLLLALAGLLTLAACAKPTPYQPAGDRYGYAERQIETNRYRVSFEGNSATPRETVERYLLYRAAELTLDGGDDYFRIADKDTETKTTYYSSGFGFGNFAYTRRVFASTAVGDAYPVSRYEAYADIQTFKGEKPADDPQAYDAHDVVDRLKGTIRRTAE